MCTIGLKLRFRVIFERLRRFAKGDKRDYAPVFSISLNVKKTFVKFLISSTKKLHETKKRETNKMKRKKKDEKSKHVLPFI